MSANPSLAVGILLSTVEQNFVIGSGWWAGRNSSLVGAGLSLRAQRSHGKCIKTTFMKTRRIWQNDDNAFNIKIHDLKPNNILHFLLVLAFPKAFKKKKLEDCHSWNLLIPLINLENIHLISFFSEVHWKFSAKNVGRSLPHTCAGTSKHFAEDKKGQRDSVRLSNARDFDFTHTFSL